MKKLFTTIAITLALAGSAFASSKTQLDEYCINISDFADKRDALTNAVAAADSVTDEEQRAESQAYVSAERTIVKQMRHDACLSADLATAKAAVLRDAVNSDKLTAVFLASAKKRLAKMCRQQAQ